MKQRDMDTTRVSPAELRAQAASTGGWQMSGNVETDPRHMKLLAPRVRNRSRCGCGCKGKASHGGYANGVVLTIGCEWSMRLWVRDSNRGKVDRDENPQRKQQGHSRSQERSR